MPPLSTSSSSPNVTRTAGIPTCTPSPLNGTTILTTTLRDIGTLLAATSDIATSDEDTHFTHVTTVLGLVLGLLTVILMADSFARSWYREKRRRARRGSVE